MRYVAFLIVCFYACCSLAQAIKADYTFAIPKDEDIPLIWRLQEEYKKENSPYDWRYDFSWKMPKSFDYGFQNDIKKFGSVEKRIKSEREESLYNDIKRMPKEFYPYVGPMLHTIKGLSGKILDMPGIKETKNQFPQRISERFQKISDIEYVSPEFYFFLMPEIFGEGYSIKEWKNQHKNKPNQLKVRINPEFISSVTSKVNSDNYTNESKQTFLDKGKRHYIINETTPLSKADVEAFLLTSKGIMNFKSQGNNEINFISVTSLIAYWDEKNGDDKNLAFLKNVVNPCQSIVRKVKWLGLRESFQEAIGEQGFDLDDWGYTCDKTLKALRVSYLTTSDMASLKILKKGLVYKMFRGMNYTKAERKQQEYFLKATDKMYDSNEENIDAVLPYKKELSKYFREFTSFFLGTPIVLP